MKHEHLTLLIDINLVCYKFTCMKSKQKILLRSKYTIHIYFYPDCYFVHFLLPLPFPFPLPLPLPFPFTCPLTFCFFLDGPGSRITVVGVSCLDSSLINRMACYNLQRSCLFAMHSFFHFLLVSIRVWHNQTHLQATSNKGLLPYFVFSLPIYVRQNNCVKYTKYVY